MEVTAVWERSRRTRDGQFLKAFMPISSTLAGSTTSTRPLPEKAPPPICVRVSGKSRCASAAVPEKASVSMTSKLAGSVTEVRAAQPEKH